MVERGLEYSRLDIESGPDSFTVFGVYGPSDYDNAQFFINLRTHMLAAENKDIIILGDLNLSLNKTKELQGYITDPHWRSRAVVNEWLESGNYTDAYRSLNPEGTRMSWMHPNKTQSGRLDYILLSAWQEN
jgi:exonuclease III